MRNLAVLRSFEEQSLFKQLCEVEKMLKKADFTEDEVVSNKGNYNYVFSKDGVDVVFVIIFSSRKNTVSYTILDKDVYENVFRNKGIVLVPQERNAGDYKIVYHSAGKDSEVKKMNVVLHSTVLGKVDGVQVDHISHNPFINTREMLRMCNTQQNAFNKPCYTTILENGVSFKVPDKLNETQREELKQLGYSFKVCGRTNCIYSPEFKTEEEMYAEINRLETLMLGEFRYNPVNDYRETWYAYVLYKMLGLVTKEELDAYVVGYFRRNPNKEVGIHTEDNSKKVPTYADIVKYYQL